MRLRNQTTLLVLVGLLVVSTYGLIRTGTESGRTASPSPAQAPLVDQSPLLTAQALSQMPTGQAEMSFAQGALQLGDQDMDLAFAAALLEATQHPAPLTAEARAIQGRLQDAENGLARQQADVARLTAAEAAATGARKDELGGQLDLAKAQLELSQDEVDDAKQDLIRAGGDLQGRIQAMVQEHDAASHNSDSTKVAAGAPVGAHGLVQHVQQWYALHQKQLRLRRAKQDAASSATSLAAKHDALETQADARQSASASGAAPGDSKSALKTTERSAADRRVLTTLDKRIDTEKQLADVYGRWSNVVAAEQWSLAHGALRGAIVILVIAIVGLVLDDWIRRLLARTHIERRRLGTLHTATRVTLQIAGALLVLLVVFGPPTGLGTFLGLAGAGLTVALSDFIISFVGWFVLMGKNGIRLGDWVEINGVSGEVAELGMFHTVLLETGNWTDSGHPTGRRVTFANSFAVGGHYFNFSTSGRWLWDELQIVLPSGQNPYPIVDAIQSKVQEATADSARQAEQEWQRSAGSRDMLTLSAAPAMTVKPVIGGTQVSVRYITRASERSQIRATLNHAAVDLLEAALVPKPIASGEKAGAGA
jgi:small-conductance mechanosensitive channel